MKGRKWRITLVFETQDGVSWAEAGFKADDVCNHARKADSDKDNDLSFLSGAIEPARVPLTNPYLEALEDRLEHPE